MNKIIGLLGVFFLLAFAKETKAQAVVYHCVKTNICTWAYGGGSYDVCKKKAYDDAIAQGATGPQLVASKTNTGLYGEVVSLTVGAKTYWGYALGCKTAAEAKTVAAKMVQTNSGSTAAPTVKASFQH